MFVSIGFIIFFLLMPEVAVVIGLIILAINFPVAAGIIIGLALLGTLLR